MYGNIVRDNIADDNGTNPAPPQFGGGGSGSGIGLFGSGPGSAVYNNVVEDNEASGNGLAGITIHAHHPGGEYLDGNSFVHNDLGTNNTGGDGFDGPPDDRLPDHRHRRVLGPDRAHDDRAQPDPRRRDRHLAEHDGHAPTV